MAACAQVWIDTHASCYGEEDGVCQKIIGLYKPSRGQRVEMTDKPPYGWKDLLTDAAIVAVVSGIVLLIVGSFPESIGKFLPFLR